MNKKPKVFVKPTVTNRRTLFGYTWPEYRATIAWALLVTVWGWIFIGYSIQRARVSAPAPLGTTIPVVIEVEAAEPVDPIKYIRTRGEELGVANEDIRTMIRIARCESNFRPRAKNPRSTASGIFQIIAGTFYSYDCVGDKWDAKDNIDCGYRIYQKSGFTPWNASKKCWREEL